MLLLSSSFVYAYYTQQHNKKENDILRDFYRLCPADGDCESATSIVILHKDSNSTARWLSRKMCFSFFPPSTAVATDCGISRKEFKVLFLLRLFVAGAAVTHLYRY